MNFLVLDGTLINQDRSNVHQHHMLLLKQDGTTDRGILRIHGYHYMIMEKAMHMVVSYMAKTISQVGVTTSSSLNMMVLMYLLDDDNNLNTLFKQLVSKNICIFS